PPRGGTRTWRRTVPMPVTLTPTSVGRRPQDPDPAVPIRPRRLDLAVEDRVELRIAEDSYARHWQPVGNRTVGERRPRVHSEVIVHRTPRRPVALIGDPMRK